MGSWLPNALIKNLSISDQKIRRLSNFEPILYVMKYSAAFLVRNFKERGGFLALIFTPEAMKAQRHIVKKANANANINTTTCPGSRCHEDRVRGGTKRRGHSQDLLLLMRKTFFLLSLQGGLCLYLLFSSLQWYFARVRLALKQRFLSIGRDLCWETSVSKLTLL